MYDPKAWSKLKDFNNSADAWNRDYRKTILEYIDFCNPSSILDVACCTGHYIRKLREEGYKGEYLGVDITRDFILKATESTPSEAFSIMDARELELGNRQFDIVLLAGILMHLPDPKEAMSEAFRVARKHVIISVYGTEGKTRREMVAGFINIHYNKDDILEHVSTEWTLRKFNRSRSRDMMQFLFERRGGE